MDSKDTSFRKIRKPTIGGRVFDFSKRKVMGILNLTPDSFFDGGRYTQQEQWLAQTQKMLNEGAHIIDLGAASTRPGASFVPVEEELKRLLPALKTLISTFPDALFSVDTYHAETATRCVENGARLINDISGGMFDPEMFDTIARLRVPYVLMHIHGTPETMQQKPLDKNVAHYVRAFFEEKVTALLEKGISDIILDPGFGFGKTLEGNYELLRNMESVRVNNLPLLAGISRKSMINKVLQTQPSQALNGTTVLHTLALLNGANLLRVHDVKEAHEAIELVEFYRNFGKSSN